MIGPWWVTAFLMSASYLALSPPLAGEAPRATPPPSSGPASASANYLAPPEFEPQDFLWMTWSENTWLGGPPIAEAMLEAIKAVSPYVPVRLLYSEWTSWLEQISGNPPQRTAQEARTRLLGILAAAGVDTDRIELLESPMLFGAIQDPGPFFLRNAKGNFALADFASRHPHPAVDGFDRFWAEHLGLPTVSSPIASDGGNRQSNGRGTLMVGEVFARSINPGRTREELERELLRVHGASKMVWLQHGPREEDNGRLGNGRWGIGTGGHIDQFARFVDERTVLLLEVAEADRERDPILAETHRRMEENLAILRTATDQDGKPLRVLRLPAAEPMTSSVYYDDLNPLERFWFEGAAAGEALTFYLPASYMNFVIANDAVVTARFWREGQPESMKKKDEAARRALEAAFPGRSVIQIDITALLYDGAGLHCYVRNQPSAGVAKASPPKALTSN